MEKSTREIAMEWWNNLSSLGKTQICDTHTELVGSVRRWETLTGREIELLHSSEKTDNDGYNPHWEDDKDIEELEKDLWNQPTGAPPVNLDSRDLI